MNLRTRGSRHVIFVRMEEEVLVPGIERHMRLFEVRTSTPGEDTSPAAIMDFHH